MNVPIVHAWMWQRIPISSPTATHSMARKKKRDDLASKLELSPPLPTKDVSRQPRILGWLVLIAGASSTWYWYRPLPPSVNEIANPALTLSLPNFPSGPKSLWTDQGLVVPSLEMPPDLPPTPPGELLSNLEQPDLGLSKGFSGLRGSSAMTMSMQD